MTLEPPWMAIARGELGVKELSGQGSNPRIVEYLSVTTLPNLMLDDATPWCAAFVCWVLEQAGMVHTASAGARSYMRWGQKLKDPRPGCIVVLRRPPNPRSGHVGFWVGERGGDPLLLGGNQRNAVTIQSYPADNVMSYRWPTGYPL